MQKLREAVKACPSGPRLLTSLERAGLVDGSDIPGLIACVIQESGQEGEPTAAAATLAANEGPAAPSTAAPSTAAGLGERASLNDALSVIDGLMFVSPRGKQQLALFRDHLLVRTAKQDVTVPWGAIQHVAIIDQIPGDTKGKVLLYLALDSDAKVMNGKTVLAAVVIQTAAGAQLDVASPLDPSGATRLRGPAPVVLCQALGAVPGGPSAASFLSPDPQYFQSANQAAGVKAHVKARDGFLYPLPSALIFLDAPQLFLPHSRIASVELMRAGGTSSTFDLVVHLRGGAPAVEFGMIARSEVAGIEDYIRKCRLAVGAEASSGEEGGEEGSVGAAAAAAAEEGEEEEDSDDPEDEDFNPASSSDEEEEEEEAAGAGQRSGGGGAKRKRSDGPAERDAASGSGLAELGEGEDEGEASSGDSSDDASSDSASSDEDDEDRGSVELVSEDDFSTGQLQSVLRGEGGGGQRGAKRRRSSS